MNTEDDNRQNRGRTLKCAIREGRDSDIYRISSDIEMPGRPLTLTYSGTDRM